MDWVAAMAGKASTPARCLPGAWPPTYLMACALARNSGYGVVTAAAGSQGMSWQSHARPPDGPRAPEAEAGGGTTSLAPRLQVRVLAENLVLSILLLAGPREPLSLRL